MYTPAVMSGLYDTCTPLILITVRSIYIRGQPFYIIAKEKG